MTGGSAGIGFELALFLANDGHDLVISGSSDRVNFAADELRLAGAEVVRVKSDLATEIGTAALLDAVAATGRRVDILILNAGIATGGDSFAGMPLERHLQLIGLNIVSPVRTAHALVPSMIAAGTGKIMLVSSLAAFSPTPYEGVYGPSKAFLTSFGHGLREELRDTGVQVTILHPGATATEFHARAGMGATGFGDNSWKNDPVEVARQGYEALLRGDASVTGGDAKTQQAGIDLKLMPEEEKARRHAVRARPVRRAG